VTRDAEAQPLETVVLVEEESIVLGAKIVVSWHVPHHDGTLRAPRHPSARTEPLERPPGVVFRTRITLALPRGALVTRVEDRPSTRTRSTLEHLTGGNRGPLRRVTRRRYRVGRGGGLEEAPGPA
jgi:hypothetical protein